MEVQRKFQSQPSREMVISVGSKAANPRTKNSRKSSEKLAGLRGDSAAPADGVPLAARLVDSAPGPGGIVAGISSASSGTVHTYGSRQRPEIDTLRPRECLTHCRRGSWR